MGKRLSKSELLQEIRVERNRLGALLEQLTRRQMTQKGATFVGWSVKDILGHLIGWQQLNLDWYAAGLRGETLVMPASGLTWRDIRKLNDRIYCKHHRRSLKAVLAEYSAFHQKVLEMIKGTPDRDFVAVGRFAWTGPTWAISVYIRANTASHYRWASKHIRKWLRAQKNAKPWRSTAEPEWRIEQSKSRLARPVGQESQMMPRVHFQ